MAATASAVPHPLGVGPRSVNPPCGAQQAPGVPQQAAGPPGAPRPQEQHHKPFFYIQPSQPYVPVQSLQWPVPMAMPLSYNPYCGYPGLGYGMPMMPNYQPAPYMEPPGFVVPHTHLHLMDYRRILNPQYYQTMAYHSRRFRYQHSNPNRQMISSEVQTEPLSTAQRTSTPGPSDLQAPLALRNCNDSSPTVSSHQHAPPALAVQKGDLAPEFKDASPPSATKMSPNGSFVIQTEEVRIECCATPVGLQLLHSHETAEVSHSFSQDVVQCSSILQGQVLQDQGLQNQDQGHLADPSDQALHACPDILLVGTPSSGEKVPDLEEPSITPVDAETVAWDTGSPAAADPDTPERSGEKDQSTTINDSPCRDAHLPLLRRMDATVWSMEETLVPSPELFTQTDHMESCDEMMAPVAEEPTEDGLTPAETCPAGEVVMTEASSLTAEQEPQVPTEEGAGVEVLSIADVSPLTHVGKEAPTTEVTRVAEADHAPYLTPDDSPLNASGSKRGLGTNVEDHQDTSFESLPAYLPSTSWLAGANRIYYCGNLPLTPTKQGRPLKEHGLDVPSRRRKLDLDYNEQPTARKPKERYKPKGRGDRRSLSDHECYVSRSFNENALHPHATKRDRLCSRCLAKRRMCVTSSPATSQASKRKAVPFQQRNAASLPTCETCRSQSRKHLEVSSPDVHRFHYGQDTEGESSENGSYGSGMKWVSTDLPRKVADLKRPLASKQNVMTGPVTCPKVREKNGVHNDPRHHSVACERLHHCPHGNTIQDRDENCAASVSLQEKWSNADQLHLTNKSHSERSWRAAMPHLDVDGFKSEARSPHFNKHKKSQPQSQGTHRKDTRC